MATKCRSRKKNGDLCAANAQIGENLCVFHDPARTADGSRARRAGGISRSRRTVTLPNDTPDHSLGNSKEVAAFLADSINQLRREQLDPRVANGIGYLTSVLLRVHEQRALDALEERLARIETALASNAKHPPEEPLTEGTDPPEVVHLVDGFEEDEARTETTAGA